MPKDYISFENFKSQHPHKPRLYRCPKCHKLTEYITTNKYGKKMCADCFSDFLSRQKPEKTPEVSTTYDEYDEV